MTATELREQLLAEIQRIPDAHLPEIFELIHSFRIGLEASATLNSQASESTVLQFAGSWADMPEETFAALESEWQMRRRQAFARRRKDEADPG